MKNLLRIIISLFFLVAFVAQAESLISKGVRISTKTLSLATLADDSHEIVIAEVISTKPAELIIQSNPEVKIQTQRIELKVIERLKGPATKHIVVNQYRAWSYTVKTGELLLWFLPKQSKYGLRSPMGIHSGDFRIREVLIDGQRRLVTSNLKGNRGLWNSTSFWDTSSRCSQEAFDDLLEQSTLSENEKNLLDEMLGGSYFDIKDRQRFRLDFLILSVRSCLP